MTRSFLLLVASVLAVNIFSVVKNSVIIFFKIFLFAVVTSVELIITFTFFDFSHVTHFSQTTSAGFNYWPLLFVVKQRVGRWFTDVYSLVRLVE